MKSKYLIILTITSIFISCQKDKFAKIEFTKEINFGTVKLNDTVIKMYQIKNTSSNPLIIKQIKTSCGCTAAKLKDSIINKNSSTEIRVRFIADKRNVGKISKSIIIDANTKPNFTVLYLKGIVIN